MCSLYRMYVYYEVTMQTVRLSSWGAAAWHELVEETCVLQAFILPSRPATVAKSVTVVAVV